jgi:agmatinase
MNRPVEYEYVDPLAYGGTKPRSLSFEDSQVVVLPIPFDRTTSYVSGTRNGPREILVASSHMELWDEEIGADVHGIGIYTLPEMEFPFGDIESCMHEIRRVTAEVLRHGKFPIILGGEHSITPPIVAAMSAAYPGLSVLQIDAHADLRDSFMGTRWNHACAIRRSLEHAPCTQVAIRSLSTEEAEVLPELKTRIFWDWNMRDDPDWIGRVVESLGEPVYVTIDVDGIDPGVMPATGTPEPGGLAWYEILRLLRAVAGKRRIVGADVVELSPIPGYIAPNFLCAKLVYKLLTYRFASSATARP